MDKFTHVAEGIKKVSTIFCYGLLVFVTTEAGVAVFYRYVLNSPILWAEEVARYTLIYLTMVASSIAIKDRLHIRLSTVTSRLSRTGSYIVEMVMLLIIIGVICIITKYSLLMVITKSVYTYSPSIAVSMVWAHTALPLGFTLIIIQTVYVLFEDIKLLIEEKSSTGE
jgi:TRAP-type C4-dicarboxylate transport system permease small subunit